MKKTVASITLACFIAGCAGNPNDPNDSRNQVLLETTAVGAAAGIATCVLVRKMTREQCAILIAGLSAVGFGAGYVLSDNIAKRKAELAGKENNLDARLRYVRALNADTAQFNAQLASDVARTRDQIDAGALTGQKLADQRKALDERIDGARKQVASANTELVNMKAYRAQKTTPKNADLDAQIAMLEHTVTEARANTTSLANQRQRI